MTQNEGRVFLTLLALCLIVYAILAFRQDDARLEQTPEEIEVHRYYNEDSQVECFYHQNAISCLWVMDGGK